ncbi:hypothetical protein [Microcoleus sp. herbarium2]|uniref:hypothetical protein n=1 Tax=Microcoleus sp. herbarium2 TaxID=3055433 RepID=UPI002FCE7DD4
MLSIFWYAKILAALNSGRWLSLFLKLATQSDGISVKPGASLVKSGLGWTSPLRDLEYRQTEYCCDRSPWLRSTLHKIHRRMQH